MSKTKSVVRCQDCGYLSPKWMGKCPNCGEWNTMVEESEKGETRTGRGLGGAEKPQRITEVNTSQLKECTNFICQFAKTKNIPVFIVGHVTKEGSIAGPRVLEHMVDSVL